MKVKVQINDKQSVEELLANNPDIEVKIKNAIVDEVAKRSAKAINEILHGTVEHAVGEAVARFCSEKNNQEIFCTGCWGNITLTNKAKEAVQQHVDRVLMEKFYDTVLEVPEVVQYTEKVKQAVNAKIERIRDMDVEDMLVREAYKALDRQLAVFNNIAKALEAKAEEKKDENT